MHNINGTINHDAIDLLDYISGFQLSSSNILPVSPSLWILAAKAGLHRLSSMHLIFRQHTQITRDSPPKKLQQYHILLGLTTLETTRIEHLNVHLTMADPSDIARRVFPLSSTDTIAIQLVDPPKKYESR